MTGKSSCRIDEASRRSGVPAKMIRYYDAIGLIRLSRDAQDCRVFSDRDIAVLRLLGGVRSIGVDMALCREVSDCLASAKFPDSEPPECIVRLRAIVEERLEAARHLRSDLERLASAGGDDVASGGKSTGHKK